MRRLRRFLSVAFCTATACVLGAQEQTASVRKTNTFETRSGRPRTNNRSMLSADDGLSILAAALDSSTRLHSRSDCSHLTHTIYQRAGFPYTYASSSDLYNGVDGFQVVSRPQPGDLIVWRGHVGIVVNPSRRLFFSSMRSGSGIDDWESPYWKSRGHVRFYRYMKKPAVRDLALSSRRPRQLVQVSR